MNKFSVYTRFSRLFVYFYGMLVLEFIGMILLAALLIITPLYVAYMLVRLFWERFIEKPGAFISGSNSLYQGERRIRLDFKNAELILISKFRYYQKLDDRSKAKFLKRVIRFISVKEFRALGGLQITEEMVVLISASAVQLTFGLKEFQLGHFKKIFIYPKEFYSKAGRDYHKGETNLGGVIVLSWKHFVEDYVKENDNLNVGLHEMAHALRFDQMKGDDYDVFFAQYMEKWQVISKEEFTKLKEQKPSVFRSYGGANFNEFFSVCVEYFFESPNDFKKALPEMYKHMTILLNQDPAAGIYGGLTIRNAEGGGSGLRLSLSGLLLKGRSLSTSVLALLTLGSASTLIVFMVVASEEIKGAAFIIAIALIVAFSARTALQKKIIHLYPDQLVLSSARNRHVSESFYFHELVSVIFFNGQEQESGGVANDVIRLFYLKNGRIQQKRFHFRMNDADIRQLGEALLAKKVPVKYSGFGKNF